MCTVLFYLVSVCHADNCSGRFNCDSQVVPIWHHDFDVVVSGGKSQGIANLARHIDSPRIRCLWRDPAEPVRLIMITRN
jgi:hypothetical protein